MNSLLASLKLVADYYPGRLYKAFVIDPPSLFSYLWKVNTHNFKLINIYQKDFKIVSANFKFKCNWENFSPETSPILKSNGVWCPDAV